MEASFELWISISGELGRAESYVGGGGGRWEGGEAKKKKKILLGGS